MPYLAQNCHNHYGMVPMISYDFSAKLQWKECPNNQRINFFHVSRLARHGSAMPDQPARAKGIKESNLSSDSISVHCFAKLCEKNPFVGQSVGSDKCQIGVGSDFLQLLATASYWNLLKSSRETLKIDYYLFPVGIYGNPALRLQG